MLYPFNAHEKLIHYLIEVFSFIKDLSAHIVRMSYNSLLGENN